MGSIWTWMRGERYSKRINRECEKCSIRMKKIRKVWTGKRLGESEREGERQMEKRVRR